MVYDITIGYCCWLDWAYFRIVKAQNCPTGASCKPLAQLGPESKMAVEVSKKFGKRIFTEQLLNRC